MSEILPVLEELGERVDWEGAEYKTTVEIKEGEAIAVVHSINGAKPLQDAILKDKVTVSVELRSPRVLTSKLECESIVGETADFEKNFLQRLQHNRTDSVGVTSIFANIISKEDFSLSTDELSTFTWGSGDHVLVNKGWKLARGQISAVDSLWQSILKFKVDDKLKDGQIAAEPSPQGDYFTVYIAKNLLRHYTADRSLQVAALIAVCAQFPNTEFMSLDTENPSNVAQRIMSVLEEKAGDGEGARSFDWVENKGYDPAYTATLLEEFIFEDAEEEEE